MVRKQTRFHFKEAAERRVFLKAMARPQEDRTTAAEYLQAEFEKDYGKAPSIETLEKKISKFRRHAKDGLKEKPWDMSTLKKYPLPPEALPAVIKAWHAMRSDKSAWTLSIRQAIWVSRLYPFVNDPLDLAHTAYICSANELMSEMKIGNSFPWSFLNVFLYEKISKEKVPDDLYNEIVHTKPVTDLGLEHIKEQFPHVFDEAKKA